MQYSKESVELAIELTLPGFRKEKMAGITTNIPQKLSDVAVEFFTRKDEFDSKEEIACLKVVQCALNELKDQGHITYGDKNLSDELAAM